MHKKIPLTSALKNQKLKICAISADKEIKGKLASMNIKNGSIISIIKSKENGSFIIGLKDNRLILSNNIVKSITVETL